MKVEIVDDNMKWIAQLKAVAAFKDGRHEMKTDLELH